MRCCKQTYRQCLKSLRIGDLADGALRYANSILLNWVDRVVPTNGRLLEKALSLQQLDAVQEVLGQRG